MNTHFNEDEGRAILRLDPADVFPGDNETAEGYFQRMSVLSNALLDVVRGAVKEDGGMPTEPVTKDVADTKMRGVSRRIAEGIMKSENVEHLLAKNSLSSLGGQAIPPPPFQPTKQPYGIHEGEKKNAQAEPVKAAVPSTFVLDAAKDIVYGARQHMYGHASVNFARTAQMWEPIFGTSVNNLQVGLAMILLKVARGGNLVQREATGGKAATFDEIEDTMKDIAGYAEATMRALFESETGVRKHPK